MCREVLLGACKSMTAAVYGFSFIVFQGNKCPGHFVNTSYHLTSVARVLYEVLLQCCPVSLCWGNVLVKLCHSQEHGLLLACRVWMGGSEQSWL